MLQWSGRFPPQITWERHILTAQTLDPPRRRYLVRIRPHQQRRKSTHVSTLICDNVTGVMATTEPNAREVTNLAAPARHRKRTAPRTKRWIWLTAFTVGGLILFAAYERQARTAGVTSDGASQALQAWDMLHGNPLLRGWTLTDVSFYTTELPEFVLA